MEHLTSRSHKRPAHKRPALLFALISGMLGASGSLGHADWQYTPLPSQIAVGDGKAQRGAHSEARSAYIRAHYTKQEFRVPMRDGVKLFTAVYVPNDASPSKRYPFLILRTPYSVEPYGVNRY